MAKDIMERVRQAQDKALEHLDYIMETVPTLDFVEIVGRVGGDVVTYRMRRLWIWEMSREVLYGEI